MFCCSIISVAEANSYLHGQRINKVRSDIHLILC